MKPSSIAIALMLTIAGIASAQAQESMQLEGTEITGNRELPMVLYIVPWKSVERFDIESPPITSIMDMPLTTIDRASFKRTINYHQAIFTTPIAAGPATE
jgi:hypothetical protein